MAGPLAPSDWEAVRLHAYQTERVLSRSSFFRRLAPTAALHHERLDGSGYHRGCSAAALSLPARVLAVADRYTTLTQPRAHRVAHPPEEAVAILAADARAGRLDTDAVAAVVKASGHKGPRPGPPSGLTPRERTVVGLLATGLQTKQVARVLGVSIKTADTTSSTPTGRWACRRGLVPPSSHCSTGSWHRENSRWIPGPTTPRVVSPNPRRRNAPCPLSPKRDVVPPSWQAHP